MTHASTGGAPRLAVPFLHAAALLALACVTGPGCASAEDAGGRAGDAGLPAADASPTDLGPQTDLAPAADLSVPGDSGTTGSDCPAPCGPGCRDDRSVRLDPDRGWVDLEGDTGTAEPPTPGVAGLLLCPAVEGEERGTERSLAGPQRWFRVELAEPGTLELALTDAFPGATLTLLDGSCASSALACLAGAGRLRSAPLPAGSYHVVVGGGEPAESGAFTLSLRLEPQGQRGPGSCQRPTPVALDAEGNGVLVGTLRGADDAGRGLDSPAGAPDAVLALELPLPGLYRFALQTELDPGWHGHLFARGRCDERASELGGQAPSGLTTSELQLALPAGPLLLFVEADGPRGSAHYPGGGGFTLQVQRTPDGDGERCASPRLLLFGPEQQAVVEGDLATADASLADDHCGEAGQPDQVYALLLPRRAALRITLEGEGLAGVALRRDCETPGPGPWCTNNEGPLITEALDPGAYTLVVRAYRDQAFAAYTLTVQLLPLDEAVPGDGCQAPLALEVSHGTRSAHAEGTIDLAVDDLAGSCGGNGGADVVYALTLARESNLDVQFQATFDAALYLRRDCPGASPQDPAEDELLCLRRGDRGALPRLPAGVYYVVVDGFGRFDRGDYTLDLGVQDAPPRPTNVDCAHAEPLDTLVSRGQQRLVADLRDSADLLAGSCGGTGGPELVWQLDLPGEASLSVVDEGGSYPYLYLRRDSCDGPEVLCGFNSLVANRLTPGRYFLIVDGSWSPGVLSTLLRLAALPPPPANDRCAGATSVALDAQGFGQFSGDTSTVGNDQAGSCAGGQAPDLFYRFRLTQPSQVVVRLDTRSFGFDGAVYLLDGCGAEARELGCRDDPEELSLLRLEAGDYWLAVDGFSVNAGRFTGQITASPLGIPEPGQSCERPLDAIWDPAGGGRVIDGDLAEGLPALDDVRCLDAVSQDRVHRLTVQRGGRVAIGLQGDPRLRGSVRLDCADPTGSFCLIPGAVQVRELAAGDYFVIARIPLQPADSGPLPYRFTVVAEPDEAPPAGAGCEAPLALEPGRARQRLVGTTIGAFDDHAAACGGRGAPDIAYRLELPRAARLRASLTAHGFDSTLALLGADCAAGPLLGCGGSGLEQLLPAGTYHLVVDGATLGSSGDFSLVVELSPVAAPGELCDPTGAGCQAGSYCVVVDPTTPTVTRCHQPDAQRQTLWAAETSGGTLLRLDPASGEVLDSLPTPDGLRGPACGLTLDPAAGSLLLVDGGNPEAGIVRIDEFTGAARGALANPAGAGAAGLALTAGLLVELDATGGLLLQLAPDSGETVLSRATSALRPLAGLAVRDGEAFYAGGDGGIWRLQRQLLDGGEGAQAPLGGPVYSGVAHAGPLLYVIAPRGEVRLLDAVTLRQVGVWQLPLTGVCSLAGH